MNEERVVRRLVDQHGLEGARRIAVAEVADRRRQLREDRAYNAKQRRAGRWHKMVTDAERSLTFWKRVLAGIDHRLGR